MPHQTLGAPALDLSTYLKRPYDPNPTFLSTSPFLTWDLALAPSQLAPISEAGPDAGAGDVHTWLVPDHA